MSIRKLTLEEWFTRHQLLAIQKRNVHLPVTLTVDVSRLAARHGPKPPWTSIVIRAVAEVAKQIPDINRVYFDTWFGPRIVEPPYVAVNVPVVLVHDGVPHLSALVVRDPGNRTLDEVTAEIRAGRERKLSDQPIGKMFIANENHVLNRLKLRLIHHVVWHFPSIYLKHGGGGISVSSLLLHNKPDLRIWAPSYGPTCFTVCITGVSARGDGKTEMNLGIGYDHGVLAGERAAHAVVQLTEILSG